MYRGVNYVLRNAHSRDLERNEYSTSNNGTTPNSLFRSWYLTFGKYRGWHAAAVPISNVSNPCSRTLREIWIVSFRGHDRERGRGRKGNSKHIRPPSFRSAASICRTDKAECRPGRDNTAFEAYGEGKSFRVAGPLSTRAIRRGCKRAFNGGCCCGRKIISKSFACKSHSRRYYTLEEASASLSRAAHINLRKMLTVMVTIFYRDIYIYIYTEKNWPNIWWSMNAPEIQLKYTLFEI